jgi:hypothetical protein
MAPPSACVTRTYMNTHKLHWDVGRIALAKHMACCQSNALQFWRVLNHVTVTWTGIEPWPPAWAVSPLEKSHPDSLLMAIHNIYI